MEWVARAVSPDGDGSHLHPLTRCKSAWCIFPRPVSSQTQIPRFTDPAHSPPNSSLGQAWKTTYLLNDPSAFSYGDGSPRSPSVYKRTTNTHPWLSARMNIMSSPLYPQDPDQAPMRTSLPRSPAHPKSSSPIHHSLHALACMRPLFHFLLLSPHSSAPLLAIQSDPSFLFRFLLYFPIEAPWHPGLP